MNGWWGQFYEFVSALVGEFTGNPLSGKILIAAAGDEYVWNK